MIFFILALIGFANAYYCQADLTAPLPVDSKGKKLRQVTIAHRHGARTPHKSNAIPSQNVTWDCDLTTTGSINNNGNTNRVFRRHFQNDHNVLSGNCQLGQLLAKGAQQHHQLGTAYRAKYVSLLQFLPNQLNQSQLFLRSTHLERTMASLEYNIGGLYPASTRKNAHEILDLYTRDAATDYLLIWDQYNCPAFTAPYEAVMKSAHGVAVESALSVLQQQLNATVGSDDVGNVLDNTWCRTCTKQPWYKGMTQQLFDELAGNYTAKYFLRTSTAELQKLDVGPFFYELLNRFDAVKSGVEQPLWAHYSVHDSTMAVIISALHGPKVWPPYAAHVEFELWEDANNDYFVQTVLNGKVLNLWNKKQSMLPIAQFSAALANIAISEADWRIACETVV